MGSKSNPLSLLMVGFSFLMWMASKFFLEKSLGASASILTLSDSKWCFSVLSWSETAEVEEDVAVICSLMRLLRGLASGLPRFNTCDTPCTSKNKQFQPIDQEEFCICALQVPGK